ncbi:MAG: type II toxin-antitoxin system VapC family toxin [Alphaproteobacteria bacterium]|nr:MAG: type II toxin-antitoxin system VapC family toxin [Alphaproteobacteria bacterium]
MQLLLDTHALLWWLSEDPALSRTADTLIRDETNDVVISPVSAIEIAIKHRLGRLPQAGAWIFEFRNRIEDERFWLTVLTAEHALRAGSYPGEHRDPFDRLLAAQAELDGLTLITRDRAFRDFPCETLW